MAKGRKRVSSKQSTGTRRQRELLDSSKCKKHRGVPAVLTKQLDGGKYKGMCSLCLIEPSRMTLSQTSNANDLFRLLTRGT